MNTKSWILVATALTLAAIPSPAGATTAIGRDRAHGARFTMTSRALTVTLERGSDVVGIAGAMIGVNCVSRRQPANGSFDLTRWPPRSRRLVLRWPHAVGPRPVRCTVDSAELGRRAFHVEALLR